MQLIAQPVNNLLRHPCILALFAGIRGKITERLPMSQDEVGQVAEEDRCKTGDEQGSVTAHHLAKEGHAPVIYAAFNDRQGRQDYSKQENRVNLGERSEADEKAGQHTSTYTGIGGGEYRKDSKRQGDYINMPLDGKFDDGQRAPGIENGTALIETLAPEQDDKRHAGDHVKDKKYPLE